MAWKLPLFFDRSNKLKLEYRTKSEKCAQVCKFRYSPGNYKNQSKKGKKAQGITKCASTQTEKVWLRREFSHCWCTDKGVDVSKFSGETHINVGIRFCT